MSFLLDTDTCSAHMRRPGGLAHRFFQYGSTISIPSIVLAELYSGAYQHPTPDRLLSLIAGLLEEIPVIDFNAGCAKTFGQLRGELRQRGIAVPTTDLLIASLR